MNSRNIFADPHSVKTAPRLTRRICAAIAASFLLSFTAQAQLAPQWTSSVSLGTAFAAGLQGLEVDPDGVAYMTGIGGPSPNTDVITSSFNPDGSTSHSDASNAL